MTQTAQHRLKQIAVDLVIVDDQQVHRGGVFGIKLRLGDGLRGFCLHEVCWQSHDKPCAFANLGDAGDRAAQTVHQPPHDAQPQTGAPCAPLVAAVERYVILENPLEVIGRDTGAIVCHFDMQHRRIVRFHVIGRAEHNIVVGAEFDRVADEVDQNLLHRARVCQDGCVGQPVLIQMQARVRCLGQWRHGVDHAGGQRDHITGLQLVVVGFGLTAFNG